MADWAVIFDVDGVLLDLTRDEEEIFFTALSHFVPTEHLSRDWNSYRIRNDDDIIMEILERNGLHASLKPDVTAQYIALLARALQTNVKSVSLPGAAELLSALAGHVRLGIATANLKAAAELRLQQAGLWTFVASNAQGADGGGHKSVILARVLERLEIAPSQVIYIGDNLNDVEAGLQNGVHFIGFSVFAKRRLQLQNHGAHQTCANHLETLKIINALMA